MIFARRALKSLTFSLMASVGLMQTSCYWHLSVGYGANQTLGGIHESLDRWPTDPRLRVYRGCSQLVYEECFLGTRGSVYNSRACDDIRDVKGCHYGYGRPDVALRSAPQDRNVDIAVMLGLGLESTEKVINALQQAKSGDAAALHELGFEEGDLMQLATFQLPSAEAIARFAEKINVPQGDAKTALERVIKAVRERQQREKEQRARQAWGEHA